MSTTEFAIWLGIFSGLCAAVIYVRRFLIWAAERYRGAVAWFKQVEKHINAIPAMQETLRAMNAQLEFNGGRSLKDMVYAIYCDLQLNEALLEWSSERAIIKWSLRDGEMVPVFVTAKFTELTGLNASDCQREGWTAIVAEQDRERVTRQRNEAMAHGNSFRVHYGLVLASGRIVPASSVSEPVLSKGTSLVIGYVGEITVDAVPGA